MTEVQNMFLPQYQPSELIIVCFEGEPAMCHRRQKQQSSNFCVPLDNKDGCLGVPPTWGSYPETYQKIWHVQCYKTRPFKLCTSRLKFPAKFWSLPQEHIPRDFLCPSARRQPGSLESWTALPYSPVKPGQAQPETLKPSNNRHETPSGYLSIFFSCDEYPCQCVSMHGAPLLLPALPQGVTSPDGKPSRCWWLSGAGSLLIPRSLVGGEKAWAIRTLCCFALFPSKCLNSQYHIIDL